MRIPAYLEAKGEGESAFAMRAGVQPQTFRNIVRNGSIPRLDNALKIFRASIAARTESGECIELDDMLPEADAAS